MGWFDARRLCGLGIVVAGATAGCATGADSPGSQTGETDEQTTASSTPTSSQTTTSGPCDLSTLSPGRDTPMFLEWEGVQRRYVLHVPADYDCTPRPVVMGIHGYYGSGEGFENSTAQMFDHLEANGYIGVFPDGLPAGDTGYLSLVTSFNDLTSRYDDGPDGPTCTANAWQYPAYDNCGPDEVGRACRWGTSCADDAGFFRAILAETQATLTVDANRIYMTGFSQGGQTVQGLACELADVLAAIAPVHGFAANGWTCAPQTPLPMLQIWGESDSTVDGNTEASSDGMIYDGAEETAAEWATQQGCDAAGDTPYPTVADGQADWTCNQHANCAGGSEVVTCSWNGSHWWPRNGTYGNMGLDVIWDFFTKHERTDQP